MKPVSPHLLEMDVRQIFKDICLKGYQLYHQPESLMVHNPSLPLGEALPHSVLLSSLVVEGRKSVSKKKIHEVPQTVNSTK